MNGSINAAADATTTANAERQGPPARTSSHSGTSRAAATALFDIRSPEPGFGTRPRSLAQAIIGNVAAKGRAGVYVESRRVFSRASQPGCIDVPAELSPLHTTTVLRAMTSSAPGFSAPNISMSRRSSSSVR